MHLLSPFLDKPAHDFRVVLRHLDRLGCLSHDGDRHPSRDLLQLDGHILVVLSEFGESRIPVPDTETAIESLFHLDDMLLEQLRRLGVLGCRDSSIAILKNFHFALEILVVRKK